MVLLRWCTLSPQGPSGLAAILFPSPVKVSSIAIFPKGAQPFSQCPDVVAVTEPQAFFLDVYFNASFIHPSSQEPQFKNALVPTRMAYAGGQVEFRVDMGSEHATRLVIIQGQYEYLSMAIYGDVIADAQEVREYEPRPIPALNSISLSKAVDPSNSSEPTILAEQLLSLLPDSPPLFLIIRLMFCLKPPDEDWDHPNFPYLYSDLDSEDEIYDLATLVQSISKPVKDDVSVDTLSTFAERINDFLGPKNADDAYYLAKLLSFSAAQRPLISRTLLLNFDLISIFDEQILDEETVLCLLDAAANVEIAQHFYGNEAFLSILKSIQNNSRTEKPLLGAVKKLYARLRGWQLFEDALTNANGEFMESANFLKDICAEEYSLGCWLECMISHENLVAKLGQHSIVPTPSVLPPLLFQPQTHILHQEFIVFVRAVIGIASVLAVWAWADCIDNELHRERACRERASSVLALWQGVDGYREILNHCLLLRQLTRRLGWITTENDPPQKSGIIAERLLVGLAKEPQTMLREDLVKTILSLTPPFCFIENDEMLEMRKLARVARDGLSSAVEELAYSSDRPFSLRRLRVLRVSMAVVSQELDEDEGEWRAIQTCWNERDLSLIPRLVAILLDISDDLNQHFTVQTIPRMNQALSELLFHTANDLLDLIARFAKTYPLTCWDLRRLATGVADLFACSERASSNFSQSSMAYLAAQSIRKICPTILRDLTGPDALAEPGVSSAQIVLRTLLDHSSESSGRDPVHHILQVYDLIDRILPVTEPETSHWVSLVFPKVLYELESFCRLLDPETKLHFVKRLVQMDGGEIGIGEYLLVKEMRHLSTTLLRLEGPIDADEYRLVLQYQVSSLVRFWNSLISSPDLTTWFFFSLSANPDLSQLLNNTLLSILFNKFSSSSLTRFVRELAKHFYEFGFDVRFSILLLILRLAQADPCVGGALDFTPDILKSLDLETINAESLRTEIGRTLSVYTDLTSIITPDTAEVLVQILEWLGSRRDSAIPKSTILAGISSSSFSRLCTAIEETVPPERHISLWDVQTKFNFDDDELFMPSTIELDDLLPQSSTSFLGVDLPLQTILSLFSSSPSLGVPSTPKGTKTPDIFGVVISPPTAILRSPAATGLTKTYVNNDFRQLRQVPSTRLNTSRLPSTHVDEFEHPLPVESTSTSLLGGIGVDVGAGDGMVPVGFKGLLPGIL